MNLEDLLDRLNDEFRGYIVAFDKGDFKEAVEINDRRYKIVWELYETAVEKKKELLAKKQIDKNYKSQVKSIDSVIERWKKALEEYSEASRWLEWRRSPRDKKGRKEV